MFSVEGKVSNKDGGKGHQPVVVVIYMPAWSPVMREV